MKFRVFGDSHAAYCFDRVDEAEIHWLGPVTMHRFAGEAAATVRDRVRVYEAGDVFAFIFGEIDIRCHVGRIAQLKERPVAEITEDLVRRYVLGIGEISVTFPGARTIILQPPFPADRRPNADLPYFGSHSERIAIHRDLSMRLEAAAAERRLAFLPFPKRYATEAGGLARRYSDDGVHIMPCEAEELVRQLNLSLGMRLRFRRSWIDVFRRRANYYGGGSLRRRGGLRRTYPGSAG